MKKIYRSFNGSLLASMLLSVTLLSGCAVGQHINMNFQPAVEKLAVNGSSVKASVLDERAEVASGKKDSAFIGTYRGGFGNTFDVSNYQKRPLAEQISQDLKDELKSLGFVEAAGAKGLKVLEVRIKEWSFDGYQNGEAWYSLQVSVLDQSGKSIYSKALTNRKEVKGTVMSGAKGGFERDMPEFYNEAIRAIVRNNKEILGALK